MDIGKMFPSRYLKVGDLDGREITVTIKEVVMENVGQTKQAKPVAYFKGANKGLVLNVTNSKRIAKIAGSDDTDDWSGTKIVLYGTETEFGGDLVECIRVRGTKKNAQVPAPEPEPKKKPKKSKATEPEPNDPIPVDEPVEDVPATFGAPDDDEDAVPF